jgi:hypothetical protein
MLSPDGEQLAADLGISADELAARAEARIDEAYYVSRTDEILRAFADAHAFSGHGIGVDYGSNPDGLLLGVTANVAVAVGDLGAGEREAEHPVAGLAANVTIMGGINLARFGHPQLTVYGNAFHRVGSYQQLDGSITSLGVHGQYRMFQPEGGIKALIFQWGGLALTGGLEAGRWSFGIADTIENDFEVDGDSGGAAVHMVSDGQLDLEAIAIAAPLEVTTSLRFFYFVSLYGGVALDLTLGQARMDATLDGTLTADPGDGSSIDMGTAQVELEGESGPSPGMLREMVGVQVNFWKLKAFVQANAMLVRAASVAFGLRIVL